MSRLYRQGFHLELSRAFFHLRTKLPDLYLTLSGEGFGLGYTGGDKSIILAIK